MALTREQLREFSRAFPSRGASRHDPTGYETLRDQIVAALRPFAAALEFELDTVEPLQQAELNEGIAQALVMIEGASFTGPEQLSPEQWGAALRLMAAIGAPYARDAADFFSAYVAVDGVPPDALPDLEEVESLFDSFAACFIEGGAGLSRRFSRVITVFRGA